MRKFTLIACLALIMVWLTPIFAQDDLTLADIVDSQANAAENAEFMVLLELVAEADLVNALADKEAELTVFAPTDEAFENLLEDLDTDLETLLEDIDLITQVLLYHVVVGIAESGDLEDGQEIETLQGGIIKVTIDEDTVTLNDDVEVVATDIEASNGIIHVIDTVLLPPQSSTEACIVSTDEADFASVHVGPGNNRTAITFLNAGTGYEALGQNEDSEGVIWYQLDKEEAAPGRAINEAWVSSAEVETSGDCENIGETSAPPLIPIISAPPAPANDAASDSGSSDSSESTNAAAPTGSMPNSGAWTIAYNEFTNVSCEGTSNLPIPRADVYPDLPAVSSTSLSVTSGSTFSFDGVNFQSIGNGVYQGAIPIGDQVATYFADNVSSSQMSGRFISSLTINGVGCSATTRWTASR